MAEVSLSVVVPVFNEASHLPETVEALVTAVEGSGFDAELVLVDDGSTDGSADTARTAAHGRLPLRVLTQANRGRFEARRAGLAAARGDYVLFLDARVRLDPAALSFVHERLESEPVWNGHVHVDGTGPFATFWRLLAELAWRDYFDDPRTTSFGADEFDRYPKGTTCFFAPRSLLEEVFDGFPPSSVDARWANDDTPILRDLARRRRIGLSPAFACSYAPRTDLESFFRHAVRRGAVFVDGHGIPESRFFPLVALFFPVSAALVVSALRRPALLAAALLAPGLAAAAYGVRAGRSRQEVRALAFVTPVYAVGHGLGMWRGLFEAARGRLAQ